MLSAMRGEEVTCPHSAAPDAAPATNPARGPVPAGSTIVFERCPMGLLRLPRQVPGVTRIHARETPIATASAPFQSHPVHADQERGAETGIEMIRPKTAALSPWRSNKPAHLQPLWRCGPAAAAATETGETIRTQYPIWSPGRRGTSPRAPRSSGLAQQVMESVSRPGRARRGTRAAARDNLLAP